MGSLKEILTLCQENEKDFSKYGVVGRDRDVNKGWIECCEFFLRNFDLTEKTITEKWDEITESYKQKGE